MLITLLLLVLMVVLVLWGICVLLIPVYLWTLASDWAARSEMAEALDATDDGHEGGKAKGKGKGRA